MSPAWWKNAVLGLVQGITEFLPISSSGHLIATKELLDGNAEPGLALDVALHIATLAAVLIYFRKDLLGLARIHNRVSFLLLVVIATIPGVILGYLLSDWRETINPWWVVGGWCFSGFYLITSQGSGGDGRYRALPARFGFLIGVAQALAIFPGVSRSGSSIVAGLWLGLDRQEAFRFSFLLSIPLILGAGLNTARKLGDLSEIEKVGGIGPLLLGMAIAFVVGLGAIHLLSRSLRSNRFHLFGLYNFGAAALFAFYLLLK